MKRRSLPTPLVVMLFVLTLFRSVADKSVPLFLVMVVAEFVGANWISGQMHASFPWLSRELCGWIGLGGYEVLLGLKDILHNPCQSGSRLINLV
jgi:hypothetical protein